MAWKPEGYTSVAPYLVVDGAQRTIDFLIAVFDAQPLRMHPMGDRLGHAEVRIDDTVLPTLSYGYKSKPLSGGGPLFPGTIDMNGVTVINQMHDVLSELIADGFTKIVVMNAHFENEAFIVEAIDLVTRETGGVATIVETNWWDPVPQSVIDKVFDGLVFPGWALEHAAVTETSLMLHYAPELVHMDRMVEEAGATAKSYVRYPVRQGDVPAHGGLANPAGSSAERGRLIAEACVDAVAEICVEEFAE